VRETVAPGTFPTPSCPDPHASTVPAHSNAGPICVSSEAVAGAAVSLDPDVSPGPWGVWMAELTLGLANSHRDLTATVDAIAWDGAQALPGADCGALVARQANGAPVCVSSTHSDALACVDLEARFSGPCSAVLRNESTIRIDELAAVLDWPEYRAQALAVGINSMLCVPLTTDGRLFGALVFYGRAPFAFTDETLQGAQLYAVHAAVALAAAQDHANLLAAVDSRDRIGQAKGILMERHKLTDSQAFAMLTKVSQNTNTPLRVIAEQLSTTGQIPFAQTKDDRSVA